MKKKALLIFCLVVSCGYGVVDASELENYTGQNQDTKGMKQTEEIAEETDEIEIINRNTGEISE